MTETVLFVGGSMDGKRITLSRFRQEFYNLSTTGVQDIYRRVIINNNEMPIFLIDSEHLDNLIPLLIEGYRRKE